MLGVGGVGVGSKIKDGKGGCLDHSGSAGNLGTQRTGGVSMEGVPVVKTFVSRPRPGVISVPKANEQY